MLGIKPIKGKLTDLLYILSMGGTVTHPLIRDPVKMHSDGQLWIYLRDGDEVVGKTELKANYFLLVSDEWVKW